MPYNSETSEYERRSTTVIDATPDGDTVAVAIDTKLDLAADDAVVDLNHHMTNGRHYPAAGVTDGSQFLKKSPAGIVSWVDGIPFEDGVAETELAASTGSAMVGFSHSASYASGTVGAKLRDFVSVKDAPFNAKGDGVTDDTAAIQAAIDHVIAAGSILVIKPALYLPFGRYKITGTLSIPSGTKGFTIFADSCGAATIDMDFAGAAIQIGDDLIYSGNDSAGVASCPNTHIWNIYFRCSSTSTLSTAIKIGNAPRSSVIGCYFESFDVSIDGHQFNYSRVENCEFTANNRSATTAFIRLQGRYDTTNPYTPGGNLFFSNNNFQANSATDSGAIGVLIHSCDGLYMTQCHFQFCRHSVNIKPLNTTTNKTVTDIKIQNCYFDDPVGSSSRNVLINGTLYTESTLQNIHFYDCYFRGANVAGYGIVVQCDVGSGTPIIGLISVHDCLFRQHVFHGIAVSGPESSYAEASILQVTDSSFGLANYGGTSGHSAISANIRSLKVSGCIVFAAANETDRAINYFGTNADGGWYSITDCVFRDAGYSDEAITIAGLYAYGEASGNVYKASDGGALGEFTATLSGGATTTPTCTGKYIRQGNIVFVTLDLTFTGLTLNGTALVVSGLPFTNNGATVAIPAANLGRAAFSASAGQFWQLPAGSTTLTLKEILSSNGVPTAVVSQSGGPFNPTFGQLQFVYFTNS